jgi:hypothetical protein
MTPERAEPARVTVPCCRLEHLFCRRYWFVSIRNRPKVAGIAGTLRRWMIKKRTVKVSRESFLAIDPYLEAG